MSEEHFDYYLDWSFNTLPHVLCPPEEPDDFVVNISGRITAVASFDSEEVEELAAEFEFSLVNFRDSHIPTVLDASADLAAYLELFTADNEWVAPIADELLLSPESLLVFQRLRVMPRHRGRGLMLRVVLGDALRVFGPGVDLVALNPTPTQRPNPDPAWTRSKEQLEEYEKFQLADFAEDYEKGKSALQRYYSKFGFHTIENGSVMWAFPSDCYELVQ